MDRVLRVDDAPDIGCPSDWCELAAFEIDKAGSGEEAFDWRSAVRRVQVAELTGGDGRAEPAE